jgi:hypothetical protein
VELSAYFGFTSLHSVENVASQRIFILGGLVTSLIGFVFSAGPFHSCLAVDAFSDLSFNATQRRSDFKLSCHRGQLINDALRKAANVPS